MAGPYCCPNCGTNRTRFNIIEQIPKAVKMDSQSGEIIEDYSNQQLDPFHIPYRGPSYKVQCGTCGLIEDEIRFENTAKNSRR
ncbi:DNA alkylation repair protein [Bacillus sp. Marseille-P3661]|uniref:DNA alkylation repair protein n=1 Tax=Bacillus sp. Marseille-P3661 TaxID=1936234 RepID=UPI000C828729|nr:DNA alkylation repair protein [Bacillus sp. Marseille-P3661]